MPGSRRQRGPVERRCSGGQRWFTRYPVSLAWVGGYHQAWSVPERLGVMPWMRLYGHRGSWREAALAPEARPRAWSPWGSSVEPRRLVDSLPHKSAGGCGPQAVASKPRSSSLNSPAAADRRSGCQGHVHALCAPSPTAVLWRAACKSAEAAASLPCHGFGRGMHFDGGSIGSMKREGGSRA